MEETYTQEQVQESIDALGGRDAVRAQELLDLTVEFKADGAVTTALVAAVLLTDADEEMWWDAMAFVRAALEAEYGG